ncbi:MAG: ferric reductase-like transmembrane domain-containing protein [Thermoanaerobaculia bacterium]|nr:ferric reductase-like transmembrane domain-containing protein [Thermoanaerobaculia bacterium]
MAWIAYGTATAATLVIWAVDWSIPWVAERELWLSRASGWAACTALALTLSMTPLSRAFVWATARPISGAQITALRRALGISSAWLALLHGAWSFVVYLDAAWTAVSYWPYLRAGLAALVVLLVLLSTSFAGFNRRLRIRLWKPLHRLSYIAGLLVFQHLLLAPFAPKRLVLGLVALLLCIELARFLPRRSKGVEERDREACDPAT